MYKRLFLTLVLCLSSNAESKQELSYCVPAKKIDLNPFREIQDGKELAFLTLLRSYISTEAEEPGLLSGFEFSPDGKTFTGRLANGLKWRDGSEVTAQQMAEGITKALPYRPIGKRIKALGVEIVDKKTFKIKLASEIENITGVFREALSTNSRHNRFWPIKSVPKKAPMVLAKFPQGEGTSLIFDGIPVQFRSETNCAGSDMSIFPEALGPDLSQFSVEKSPAQSSIFVQIDSRRLNVRQRTALVSLLRHYFSAAPTATGVVAIDGFFLAGEPGFKENLKWPKTPEFAGLPDREIVIGFEHPLFTTVLANSEAVKSKRIRLVSLPSKDSLDAHILASGMQDGRHVIFQDILKWSWIEDFLTEAPSTLKYLKEITARSASTIPPDNLILTAFEFVAMKESALAPLARRHPVAYSRNGIPVRLSFNRKGEITFRKGKP